MPKLLYETSKFKAIVQDYKLQPFAFNICNFFCEENFIKKSS
jgi:hypothetical protein